jgi:hypothetical protein
LAQARTPQRLVLFRLSEPEVQFDKILNDETLRELGAQLAKMEGPTALHLDLDKSGVQVAASIFGQNAQDERFLHIVSDFRQLHWGEPEGKGLLNSLQTLSQGGVKIHFLDAAHPHRSEKQKVPGAHDNVAVVELRPETRVAAEGMPVQFTITVANYSAVERKNVRITVRVNGEDRPDASQTILSVPPGRTSQTFPVTFVSLKGDGKDPKKKDDGKGVEYQVITAQYEPRDDDGLPTDNLHFAVIEVRPQVPVLVIDGDLANPEKQATDFYYVETVLSAARGYRVMRRGPADLERTVLADSILGQINLDQIPSIYLLNVRELSEKAQKNLEAYVALGGGVVFFLGDKVNPAAYNNNLYAGGLGIFPAPLSDQPTKALTDEEKLEKQLQNLESPRLQLFVRSDMRTHPIVAELYKNRSFMTYLNIDRHFPVARSRWKKEEGRVEELATLPNDKPVENYREEAQRILDSFPVDEPQYEKYKPALEKHRRAIRDTLLGKSLQALGNALDALLPDSHEGNEPDAALAEFWEKPDVKIQELRDRVDKFRQAVKFGDPLIVAQRYHKGRVVAFFTTAGKKWNDWAAGGPASVTYPGLMIDLQKHLTGVDTETNKAVGEELRLERASTRYEPRMRVFFQDLRDQPPGKAAWKDLGEVLGQVSGETLTALYDKTQKPGVYRFDFTQRAGETAGNPKTEPVAFAFNVDTAKESDLRRTSTDDLTRLGVVHAPEAGSFANLVDPHRDLSESAWLYVLFLIILVAEQALAVHLSFHLRDSEALAPAQAVRPRATAA